MNRAAPRVGYRPTERVIRVGATSTGLPAWVAIGGGAMAGAFLSFFMIPKSGSFIGLPIGLIVGGVLGGVVHATGADA